MDSSTTPGTYTATIITTSQGDTTKEATATATTIVALANQPPTANFTVTPTSGDTTTNFNLDASSSTDDKDPVTSLQVRWDWEDDGAYDTGWTTTKTASQQYTIAGTYTIKLEVKDTGGLTATATKQIVVTLPNNPPVANAGTDFWVTQGEAFTLDGSASYDPDGDPLTYTWDDNYGDFVGVTGVKPSVTLNTVDHGNKKKHNITLTVSDGRGGLNTDTVEVTVIPPWAPTEWSDLEISYFDGEVNVTQRFSWNQGHLDYLKKLDVHYQWELRRDDDKDYWDYWRPGKECYNHYYWTNLNDPTDFWTEEVKRPSGCPSWRKEGNEEFEIKSEDVDSLEPGKTYFATASFLRKDPGKPMNVTAKSEYCGKIPFCNFGQKFDWFAKLIKEVVS